MVASCAVSSAKQFVIILSSDIVGVVDGSSSFCQKGRGHIPPHFVIDRDNNLPPVHL